MSQALYQVHRAVLTSNEDHQNQKMEMVCWLMKLAFLPENTAVDSRDGPSLSHHCPLKPGDATSENPLNGNNLHFFYSDSFYNC
jgi:hypothetical protein